MNQFIKQIQEKNKYYEEAIKEIPFWDLEKIKSFYKQNIPELYRDDLKNSQKTLEDVEEITNIALKYELSYPKEECRTILIEILENEIKVNKKFLHHYLICSQEYGLDLPISKMQDIYCDYSKYYIVLRVPKVNLTILCDLKYNVVKKNLNGENYFISPFTQEKDFYEQQNNLVYYYPSWKSEPILVGPHETEVNYFYQENLYIIQKSNKTYYCFHNKRKEIIINDFDDFSCDINQIQLLFNHLDYQSDNNCLFFKTISLPNSLINNKLAYLVDTTQGIIISEVVNITTGMKYDIDKNKPCKEAIDEVYNQVLEELKLEEKQRLLKKEN